MKIIFFTLATTLFASLSFAAEPISFNINLSIKDKADGSVVNLTEKVDVDPLTAKLVNIPNGKDIYSVYLLPKVVSENIVSLDYYVRVPTFVERLQLLTTLDGKQSLWVPVTESGISGTIGLKKGEMKTLYDAPDMVTVSVATK